MLDNRLFINMHLNKYSHDLRFVGCDGTITPEEWHDLEDLALYAQPTYAYEYQPEVCQIPPGKLFQTMLIEKMVEREYEILNSPRKSFTLLAELCQIRRDLELFLSCRWL